MAKKKVLKKTARTKAARAAKPHKVSSRALESVRKKLLAMREDLAKTVDKQKTTDMLDTGDAADQAASAIEKEISFELSDVERATLVQIEAALRKIGKGSYGSCESCSKPIAKSRLNALPFARYCITCQNSAEQMPEGVEAAAEPRPFSEES